MASCSKDYHILVAQNFLANISLDGSHQDTNLRIFTTRGLPKVKTKSGSVLNEAHESSLNLKVSTFSVHRQPSFEPREWTTHAKVSNSSIKWDGSEKKKSIFRRLAKIMSSDDVVQHSRPENTTDEENRSLHEENAFERAGSSLSTGQFNFLRRLKSTISNGERWYECSDSSSIPLAVFSYILYTENELSSSFPLGSLASRTKKTRSKSIFGSSDRMRSQYQSSFEELRPFVFRENEEHLIFGQLFRKQRRSTTPFFTLFDKPHRRERRESQRESKSIDFLIAEGEDEYAQAVCREGSCVQGYSLDTEEPVEAEEDDYDAYAFNDLQSGRKTVIRLNSFVATTFHYLPPDRAKATMNEDFLEKYPNIQLTLSKMKSLKQEMNVLAKQNSVDSYTLSIALVYFEKIVTKALISKTNRKCVAGVSLLVAMKLNDFNKNSINAYLESAAEKLRVLREDILAYELPLCVALCFRLVPTVEELTAHNDKLQFDIW